MEREILNEIVGNVSLARVQELQAQLREKQAEIEMYQQKGTLSHGMNCPGNVLGEEDVCTCGLGWRSILQTEQTMHAAWRKRAEEAERQLAASQREVERLRADVLGEHMDSLVVENNRLQAENAALRTLLRELAEALEGYMRVHGTPEGHCFHIARAALARAEEGMK